MADYAISNVDRRIVYTGSAGVGPYAFNFEVLDQTDIAVYKNATLLVLTTNYTVSINPSTGVGSVTLNVAATSSDTITIVGARAIRRTTDFTTGGDLFANSLNDELDSLTIFSQQVAETAERGIKAPVTDPTDINMTLPAKATRAGTVLAFNATTGNPEAGPSIGSVTTVADQSANINTVATNIASVNTVAGNNSNINTVAGISGNVTTVAGISANVTSVAGNSSNINTVAGISGNVTTVAGVSSSVSTVAGISANVTTVAGISSNVTTVAGVSANVTTVATNIAAVNTNATNIVAIQNASTNATNAAASAVSAGNAQTAAEAARDATLAAYDNFDDRYLGSKTSNPTLDNDGNALVAGSLYFNSVSGAMQVYTGSAWVAAYVSGTGFLASANNLSDVASTSSARTNLGLGTIATQAASSVAITGGSINGTTIGASTPSTGAFSTLSATGVTTVQAGTVSAPAITTSGDTNTGIYFPAADTIAFTEGGAEAMRINSSGNVGIGIGSPTRKLHVYGGATGTRTMGAIGNASEALEVGVNASNLATINSVAGSSIIFTQNNTERARIDSSGNLRLGTTSGNADAKMTIYGGSTNSSPSLEIFKGSTTNTTSQVFMRFEIARDSTPVASGSITANGAAAATFTAWSDRKLKENIVDLPSQLANIMALRPVEFDYKGYKNGEGHQIGFIAQEVQQVYPDLVAEGDGGMLMLSDMNKNDARLIKAIQEQQAMIDTMKQEIAELKAKVGQ